MTAAWFEDRKMELKNKVKHLCPKLLWQLFYDSSTMRDILHG
jgi:hypothetical protein